MRPDDLTFRLAATGITMPHGGYRVTDTTGTLRLSGRRIGTITRDPDGIADLEQAGAGDRARVRADLTDFARSCTDPDGLPVTLSGLLDALLTEHQPHPAKEAP